MADLTLDQQISNFLRDAQYRVAELSNEGEAKRQDRKTAHKEDDLRSQLLAFIDLLYDSIDNIKDDYTTLKTQ